jgi:hypothetical protein
MCDRFIREGRCQRNAEGKLVLPNGAYLPRYIQGRTMRERFDEWHTRNPGNLGQASSMFFEVVPDDIDQYTPPDHASVMYTATSREPITTHMDPLARIEYLEREIMQLRRRELFDGVHIEGKRGIHKVDPRHWKPTTSITQQPADTRSKAVPIQPKVSSSKAPASIQAKSAEKPCKPVEAPTKVSNPESQPVQQVEPPVHPFAKVQERNYLPPHDKNFATVHPKKKEHEKDYTVKAPIEDTKLANDVFGRWLNTSNITISNEELLSLSPEMRQKIRDVITTRRIPSHQREVKLGIIEEESISSSITEVPNSEAPIDIDDPLPYAEDPERDTALIDNQGLQEPDISSNAIIIPDPHEVYLNSLPPGQNSERNYTSASECESLRSINLFVNNRAFVEAIIDPGCQIIAMSEKVCHFLGMIFDPTIKIKMQSANKASDSSLGLARNVPCKVGDITLYLQIHVLRAAAYDILLGRPFDVLTGSTVRNFADTNQTITITDPNSHKTVTIPTQPRGSWRPQIEDHSSEVFQDQ